MKPGTAVSSAVRFCSVALALAFALAGCGLKGALYLPEKAGEITIRPGPGSTTPPAGSEAPENGTAPTKSEAPKENVPPAESDAPTSDAPPVPPPPPQPGPPASDATPVPEESPAGSSQ